MKIIVTGSLGHISLPLTKELVQRGHTVTVVSSNPEKQKDIEALGAEAAIGSIEDADFLAAAFTGFDAVYCMVPPPKSFLQSTSDPMAYFVKVAGNYVQAIENSGVKRVVYLSSIGAHLDHGSGLILGHHKGEVVMKALTDVSITFIRPVGFYYNLYSFLGMIKTQGFIAANYGADENLVWVSPIDIAAAVADELEAMPSAKRKIRYVASDELTGHETARILGEAVGKPDLKWNLISTEQMQNGLIAAGLPPNIAAGLAEMFECQYKGILTEDYYRNRPAALGKVKLTDFAKEFAATFNQL